jgi:ribosomal protein L37E
VHPRLGDSGIANVKAGTRTAGKSEPSRFAIRCRGCGKHIIWPGLCYTCATGLPRRMLPETLVEAEPTPGESVTPALPTNSL